MVVELAYSSIDTHSPKADRPSGATYRQFIIVSSASRTNIVPRVPIRTILYTNHLRETPNHDFRGIGKGQFPNSSPTISFPQTRRAHHPGSSQPFEPGAGDAPKLQSYDDSTAEGGPRMRGTLYIALQPDFEGFLPIIYIRRPWSAVEGERCM